jgi:hypothetical protein
MVLDLTIPDSEVLVKAVFDSLDEVARVDDRVRGNWTNAICTAIKRRLHAISPEIGVAFGRDASKPFEEREFLFDLVAFTGAQEPDHTDWYTMQALIVGEVEFNGNLGRDFEKLMFADSLICVFVFSDWIKEHKPIREIEFLSRVAEKRVRYVSSRGSTPPPIFLIASYSAEHRNFTKRVIQHAAH